MLSYFHDFFAGNVCWYSTIANPQKDLHSEKNFRPICSDALGLLSNLIGPESGVKVGQPTRPIASTTLSHPNYPTFFTYVHGPIALNSEDPNLHDYSQT